jgi:hypothetical protein
VIFVGCTAIPAKLKISVLDTGSLQQMIESQASYRNRVSSDEQSVVDDRLAPGPAFLTLFGLSLLCWVIILVPLAAILHK